MYPVLDHLRSRIVQFCTLRESLRTPKVIAESRCGLKRNVCRRVGKASSISLEGAKHASAEAMNSCSLTGVKALERVFKLGRACSNQRSKDRRCHKPSIVVTAAARYGFALLLSSRPSMASAAAYTAGMMIVWQLRKPRIPGPACGPRRSLNRKRYICATGIQKAHVARHCATRSLRVGLNWNRSRTPSIAVTTTASLWFTEDGIAPNTGASVACETGEERAASVRNASGRATRSAHGFAGSFARLLEGGA